ncbi:MAG: DUF3693 domain-containing protein [Betaproteobacteria bacterium]|nr:DUF3693 domain-containing protein [Betaproteobacteria bacterium]
MKTTIEWLNDVKAAHSLTSDYQLSKFLGVTAQCISVSMKGHTFLSDDTAIKVAKALGIDPAIVMASVHYERAKKAPEKDIWRGIFERLGGLAAALVLGLTFIPYAPDASATTFNKEVSNIYIMRSNL